MAGLVLLVMEITLKNSTNKAILQNFSKIIENVSIKFFNADK